MSGVPEELMHSREFANAVAGVRRAVDPETLDEAVAHLLDVAAPKLHPLGLKCTCYPKTTTEPVSIHKPTCPLWNFEATYEPADSTQHPPALDPEDRILASRLDALADRIATSPVQVEDAGTCREAATRLRSQLPVHVTGLDPEDLAEGHDFDLLSEDDLRALALFGFEAKRHAVRIELCDGCEEQRGGCATVGEEVLCAECILLRVQEHEKERAAGLDPEDRERVELGWIGQEDDHGCAVAVFAMLTGSTYQEAKEQHGLDIGGWRHGELRRRLEEAGFYCRAVISREQTGNVWPPSPFAPAHFAVVHQNDTHNAHVVVVDQSGAVLDPLREGRYCLSDWSVVQELVGVAGRPLTPPTRAGGEEKQLQDLHDDLMIAAGAKAEACESEKEPVTEAASDAYADAARMVAKLLKPAHPEGQVE